MSTRLRCNIDTEMRTQWKAARNYAGVMMYSYKDDAPRQYLAGAAHGENERGKGVLRENERDA